MPLLEEWLFEWLFEGAESACVNTAVRISGSLIGGRLGRGPWLEGNGLEVG